MPPDPSHVQGGFSKWAQMLGETIIHHAPWTAEINEQTKRRVTDAWLENLEKHATSVVSPLVDQVLAASDPPEAIATLLEAAARPSAQFGATIQQFFVYGVMFNLAQTALAPFTQVVANDIWSEFPTRPLSPPDIATMVVRGIAPGDAPITPMPGWASDEAKMTGIDPTRMQAVIDSVGNPPAPQDLFQMIRRGIINEDQLTQGIREGDTRDEWIPQISKLRYTTPTPIDLVRAAVQNQMDYATASGLAQELGLEPPAFINDNPDWFQLLFDIAGRPPGPQESGRMANRGIIPFEGTGADVLSFQQDIAESDIKTKWTPALQKLQEWWPNNGEIKELLVNGAIDADTAKQYWTGNGVPASLLPAMLHQAQIQEVTTEKALAKGNILTLLYDGAISQDTAKSLLEVIGIQGNVATYVIEITTLRREIRALDMAIRKVGNYYVNYKLTATATSQALETLGVPQDQITSLLSTWASERELPIRLPTIGELGDAVRYAVIDAPTAIHKAMLLGYTEYDAWLILSALAHAQIAPPPPDTDTGVDV